MDELKVIDGGGSNVVLLRPPGAKLSPDRPPGLTTGDEIEIWEYICKQLQDAGVEHLTFGLAAAVVCSVYAGWRKARMALVEFETKNNGSYMVKTPNGYEQPHQLFYVVEKYRRELLQWLPECCLTIPSYAAVKAKLPDENRQRDLPFEDMQAHVIADRRNYANR